MSYLFYSLPLYRLVKPMVPICMDFSVNKSLRMTLVVLASEVYMRNVCIMICVRYRELKCRPLVQDGTCNFEHLSPLCSPCFLLPILLL